MSAAEGTVDTAMDTQPPGSVQQTPGQDQQVGIAESGPNAAAATVASAVEVWDTPVAITTGTVLASTSNPIAVSSALNTPSTVASTPTAVSAAPTVIELVANRSPASQQVNQTALKRMLYKVKFQAHLEDGRLILLEDTIFEAAEMETTNLFLDAVSTLEVCKRIMTALRIESFHSELVKVKVAFNEPGHGFKGRKQYLYQPVDWKSMYSLFNSLRKKTIIYMTFDVRRKVKESPRSSAVPHATNQKPVSLPSKPADKPLPSPQSESPMTPNGMCDSTGQPLSKRLLYAYDASRFGSVATPPTPCPNCSGGTLKRLETRCSLREQLLAQLKAVADLSGGKLGDIDEDVLRKVQQDTLEDITLLCSQT